ncbi:beta-ketoacyl-ACP synthase II [Coprothermobacter platensis]|uniref:beta-ketoacyl-ACP synthase II n=1 Tax=Coprothermobacter platensis TaxID=108819 RepID=UPI00036318DB|nr:beta-ketoacyl-ACP synthase II [Coprothermobacter platensis]
MKRIVITGMGVVTPFGVGLSPFKEGIFSGANGIKPITRYSELPVKFAGEVDFDPLQYFDKKDAKRMDRFTQFGSVAAHEALEMANLHEVDPYSVGVVFASGMGGLEFLETQIINLYTKGQKTVSPFTVPASIVNIAAANIAIQNGFHGPAFAPTTACAASLDAIGQGFNLLQQEDDLNAVLVGGSEASITPLGITSFYNMKALSPMNEPTASRPFDKNHSGFVMGEGAGALVLETLEHALSRGATPLAEIVGYGATCDGYHVTAPDPSAEPQSRAILKALKKANIQPEQIDYVCAHGTSTPLNDVIETKSLKKAFGEHAYNIPVSSIKSMIGHLLGASGAVETVASVLALQEQMIPPTINFQEPAEECDLYYVPNKAEKREINYVLKESLGFGGHNSVVVLKRYEG